MMSAEKIASHSHLVQFYGTDERLLASNVAAFLTDSVAHGGAALIVAEPNRKTAIIAELRDRLPTLDPSRVLWMDGTTTLASLMDADRPSPARFDAVIGTVARKLITQYGALRAYGEMVGILWSSRKFSAAIALEQIWNDAMARLGFDLFCGYPIDVLEPQFQPAYVDAIVREHTALVSSVTPELETALFGAIEEHLGPRGTGLDLLSTARAHRRTGVIPIAESVILWLRNNFPRYADEVLGKARERLRRLQRG